MSWSIGYAYTSGGLSPIICTGGQTAFGGGAADLTATQTLAASGAVTINANNGNVQAIALLANATSSAITSPVTGQELTIQWIQDATGSRTYAWPPNCKFAGGAAPSASSTAGYTDSVTFVYNGTHWLETCRSIAIH